MRSSSAANMSISSSSNGLMEDECGTVKQFECHEHGGSVSESENQYNTSNHKGTNILILNELDIKKIVSNNDYSSISKKDFIGEMSSSNSRKINRENDLLVRRLSCSSQNSAQASVRSISDNNNKPTLFANPAFNRFFNPPTTLNSLQPTIFYKQKDDKMQTTQYNYNYNHNQNHHNNTNNYYYNNKVQGSLNSHINNQNKVEFEEDAAVSVAATKLKEYLDFEENNNNNNNSSSISPYSRNSSSSCTSTTVTSSTSTSPKTNEITVCCGVEEEENDEHQKILTIDPTSVSNSSGSSTINSNVRNNMMLSNRSSNLSDLMSQRNTFNQNQFHQTFLNAFSNSSSSSAALLLNNNNSHNTTHSSFSSGSNTNFGLQNQHNFNNK